MVRFVLQYTVVQAIRHIFLRAYERLRKLDLSSSSFLCVQTCLKFSLCYFPAVPSAIPILHLLFFFVPSRLSYFLRSLTGRCAQTFIKSKHTVAMW